MLLRIARYLPMILLIGIAIGIANFAIGFINLLGRSILQSIITSFLIGLPLTAIAEYITDKDEAVLTTMKTIVFLAFTFAFVGIIGSELLLLIIQTAIEGNTYFPFTGKGIYLFNAILSEILGFSFVAGFKAKKANVQKKELKLPKILSRLPVKKGQTTSFIALDEVVLFEASDKFSFFYDKSGVKRISDYSLGYLETKLPDHFLRIHRKYLINTHHIRDIEPYAKGRYAIRFTDDCIEAITSSQGYSNQIKLLMKI